MRVLAGRASHVLMIGGTVSAMAGLIGAMPAMAQTASQITPPSYAPPIARSEAPIALPESPSDAAPPGAEALSVTLGDIVIDGEAIDAARMARLRDALIGRPVRVSEIFAAARALEVSYARAGYPLRRVIVPAQQIVDGAMLHLRIVDGFIERVDVSRLPRAVQRRIGATLAPLVGQRQVTMGEIERRLLLASDVPGVSLRSALASGSTAGATILVVEARHRAVTAYLSFDNSLAHALGRVSVGVGVNLNSVLGLGEEIYLRASGLPNSGGETGFLDSTPRNRALAAGVTLPIGHDGLEVNLEASETRTAPRHGALAPGFGSRFTRYAGRVSYPFVRRRALTLIGQLSLDVQQERVDIIAPVDLPISLDRQRVLRAAGIVQSHLPGDGQLRIQLEGSAGLNALGARSAADANPLLPLSRQGADAAFQKLRIDGAIEQPVASHLTLALNGQAQTSFGDPLTNAEQFGIASAQAISPLPAGALQGDAGYALRGELRAPFSIATSTSLAWLTPYAFGARAGVWLEAPTVFEQRHTSAYAYGAGLRLSGAARDGSPGVFVSIEYGRAHIRGVPGESDRVSIWFVGQF